MNPKTASSHKWGRTTTLYGFAKHQLKLYVKVPITSIDAERPGTIVPGFSFLIN